MTSPAGIWSLLSATRRRNREQWYRPDRLRELRQRRLRRLAEAASRTAHYREVFRQAGVDPAELTNEDSLRRLPLLEKATLQERGREMMLTQPAETLGVLTTSGSTGVPLRIFRSARDQGEVSALWARLWRAYGRGPFDRQVNIGSGRAAVKAGPVAALRKLGILPELQQLSSFDPPDRQIALLRQVKPHVLSGYAIALEMVADAVLAAGVRDIRPRIVHSGSMVLTDRCRVLCKEAFGVAPLDVYATIECGPLAWECPASGGLHLNDDVQIVEIVDDAGRPVPEGEPGHVVVTQLNCTAQPLIRYRIGDIASCLPPRCSCGRGLGLLGLVQGRSQHTIRTPDGRVLTTAMIAVIMGASPQVRRYQVRQTGPTDLRILVVPSGEWTPAGADAIRRGFDERLGAGVRCDVVPVDDIPLAPSGKFQTVVPLD